MDPSNGTTQRRYRDITISTGIPLVDGVVNGTLGFRGVTHFSPLLFLDLLLIQVLNIVVNLVLSVLLLQVMMAQDERGPMMVVILEMMVEILQIDK